MDVKTELTKPRNKHSEHKNIKAFEVRIIRDIKNLFEQDYYKPLKISNFFKKNCIEYESNDERYKTLPIKE